MSIMIIQKGKNSFFFSQKLKWQKVNYSNRWQNKSSILIGPDGI